MSEDGSRKDSFMSPRVQGHRAYHDGKSKDENPYADTDKFVDEVDWNLGWKDAAAGIPEGK
jgi:ribosome modulation factor